mmetsp:Transcript_101141/g.285150  ORF Transcript_101141/g.285150 Transcript_101141/m.285150 type:complete len:227 (+) Transcript_101141:952-1632(+)
MPPRLTPRAFVRLLGVPPRGLASARSQTLSQGARLASSAAAKSAGEWLPTPMAKSQALVRSAAPPGAGNGADELKFQRGMTRFCERATPPPQWRSTLQGWRVAARGAWPRRRRAVRHRFRRRPCGLQHLQARIQSARGRRPRPQASRRGLAVLRHRRRQRRRPFVAGPHAGRSRTTTARSLALRSVRDQTAPQRRSGAPLSSPIPTNQHRSLAGLREVRRLVFLQP